ncbi:6-carboxytetrahydropterin synthase [Pseudoalteromonas luteoviolacea]|uniref:6-carboxy-5,6,7,8-tetrahydropterin synthase n=1 Tax=Pseudoalteromonas luteoviolacea H33 TaxID=1365251 RepID=A0A167GJ54_9GAMM|nr:6-carboxytetrahydropterin synthase [Pseudoalteromonas luteoviolacea]KZN55506.1 isocitrate dehydrogenase (NADP(+)) [Pseudoalteromonas luteoviolacea H33]KZN74475.1 isocitrate dehydrogenase (NADP(+)) [Pseudoalteromonas luteoviolacea H33-S]MBQ4879827.1 6-carboxytetrahydropterin synthase [Pseudoalteromonas luteoviolacea]MBQ4908869.1 6-carboxytetrahydropterin synthase [Pseudoalteromonas luteoviolacea]
MILFVDALTVIDFSYLCAKRGAVGESWIVDMTLHGQLNEESMVLDFAKVKKQIKAIIDNTIDHKLAIPSALNCQFENRDGRVSFDYEFSGHHLAMNAPDEAVCVVEGDKIDEASVIAFLKKQILPQMPDNVKDIEITLRPEQTSSFYYHYSHGLKKHDGNCQRIIHGHRSLIGIFFDGVSMPRLQKEWSQKWEDIYLGTQEDLIEHAQLQYITAKVDDYSFAYESSQGYFEMCISKSRCDILPCDTTVECIAEYLANEIKKSNPDKEVKVRAYEGVGKGAIAYA